MKRLWPIYGLVLFLAASFAAAGINVSNIPRMNASRDAWSAWEGLKGNETELEIRYSKGPPNGSDYLINYEVRFIGKSAHIKFMLVFDVDGSEVTDITGFNLDQSPPFNKTGRVIQRSAKVLVKARAKDVTRT
jgi:hypothetical protein